MAKWLNDHLGEEAFRKIGTALAHNFARFITLDEICSSRNIRDQAEVETVGFSGRIVFF